MFPNATTISQTLGLVSANAVAQTQGLQPNMNQDPNNRAVTYITPALLPPIGNSPANYQVSLSNQLAGQLAKLFQDLFPITTDPFVDESEISNIGVLNNNLNELMSDINQIKMTILTINQITVLPTSRIPTGFRTPNSDSVTTAGLSTAGNNNPVLNIIDQIWTDLDNKDYISAQLDYGILRNLLRPYFGI